MLLLLLPALLVTAAFASAQNLDYPDYGLRLAIPEDWVGREVEAGLLLGSDSVPGVVLITTNDAGSIEELKATAETGISDDAGTSLISDGNLEAIGSNGLAGEFSGTLEGVAARAYVIGLLNPTGTGITIMAVTEAAQYSSAHREVALAIARGVEFYIPPVSSAAEQWRQSLLNQRLAFHHSSYSSSGSGYSGYQSSEEIFLCAPGYFLMRSRERGSFDATEAFGSLGGNQAGEGKWTVIDGNDGSVWLRLEFHDGSRREERLEMSGSRLLLNGSRYFYGATDQCG